MNKQIPIWICIFLFLALAITAVKPVTQLSANVQGLEMEFPRYEYIEQNTMYKLHTHVINKSNGIIITNETTKCFLHLYNKSGSHILEEYMGWDSNGLEFKLDISAGNFSTLENHAYIIQCNGSAGGAFVAGNFEVTKDGNEPIEVNAGSSSLAIMIFILLVNGALFYLSSMNFTKNEWSNFAVKRAIIVVAIYLMVLNSSIAATIAAASGIGIVSEMFRYMWFFGIAGYVSMLYLFFTSVLGTIELWKKEQVKMRMGEQ